MKSCTAGFPLFLLALLAGGCATERSVQRAADGVAATAAIVTSAVARFAPPPAALQKLSTKQQAAAQLVPVIVLNAMGIWHAIDEYIAATRPVADAGVAVDGGAP